jgi:hypothetical protein
MVEEAKELYPTTLEDKLMFLINILISDLHICNDRTTIVPH